MFFYGGGVDDYENYFLFIRDKVRARNLCFLVFIHASVVIDDRSMLNYEDLYIMAFYTKNDAIVAHAELAIALE
jgi:hypothetical protein